MARWKPNGDGTSSCADCEVASFSPATGEHCKCPPSVVAPTTGSERGQMERLTLIAHADGMIDRLGVERLLASRILRADKDARFYIRLAKRALDRGAVAQGREGPVDADENAVAQKWCVLAESANNRGDKAARALFTVVTDRERRADLERREALAAGAMGKAPSPKQPRGTA